MTDFENIYNPLQTYEHYVVKIIIIFEYFDRRKSIQEIYKLINDDLLC